VPQPPAIIPAGGCPVHVPFTDHPRARRSATVARNNGRGFRPGTPPRCGPWPPLGPVARGDRRSRTHPDDSVVCCVLLVFQLLRVRRLAKTRGANCSSTSRRIRSGRSVKIPTVASCLPWMFLFCSASGATRSPGLRPSPASRGSTACGLRPGPRLSPGLQCQSTSLCQLGLPPFFVPGVMRVGVGERLTGFLGLLPFLLSACAAGAQA